MSKLILSLWVDLICRGSHLCDPQAPKKDSFSGFLRLQRQMNQHIKLAKPGDMLRSLEDQTPVHQDSFTAGSSNAVSLLPSLFSNSTKLHTQLCVSLAQLESLTAKEPTSLPRMTWNLGPRGSEGICAYYNPCNIATDFLCPYSPIPSCPHIGMPHRNKFCRLLSFIRR